MRRLTLIPLLTVLLACSKPSPPAPTTVAGTNTTIAGSVLERLDGPPYSYLRLKTDKGEVWAAVPMDAVKDGKKVTVSHCATLKNFKAPRLDRRFDQVVFGVVDRR